MEQQEPQIEISEYDHLVYRVLDTEDGQKLIGEWNEQLRAQRFFPGESHDTGIFREGGVSMLRHIINCYNNVKHYS